MRDKSLRNQNGDCVMEYDATHARSRCYNETGITETLSTYEIIGPTQLRVTPIDIATGKPKAQPAEMNYRIEGSWLLFNRQFASATSTNSNQPTNLRSVAIRVSPVDSSHCEPIGETGLRVGRTPKSSLSMSTPSGWQPLLVDPAVDKRLGPAVNASLFIGAFVPATNSELKQLVIVLDDVRSGPIPVQATEFNAVKKRFASELEGVRLTCDQPDRACASLKLPDGGQVYTELINMKGRVAIVTGTVGQSKGDATALLERSVQTFVERLRAENAKK